MGAEGGVLNRIRRVAALMADPRVKKLPRFAVLAAIAYLVWPVDLVPDFLVPVAGWLDDAMVLWLSLRWLLRSAPPAERVLPE